MSFQDELKQSVKTKEQVRDEAAEAIVQQEYRIAEYIYNCLKWEILQKAKRAEAAHGKISGIFEIEYDGNYKDRVPYSNPFEVKYDTKCSQSSLIFAGRYAYHDTFAVKNMAKLDAVWAKMRDMAEADGITLGEPFLYLKIIDAKTKRLKTERRITRKFGKLSGDVRYVQWGGMYKRIGKAGGFALAVEYECRV